MTSKRALICSWYMPQGDLDSYSRRLFHFVEFLRETGWSVTCVVESSAGVEQYAGILEAQGVRVHVEPWDANRGHVGFEQHVERLATAERFDVAILGFWNIAELLIKTLRHCCPTTRIIVDSGDLHFLRRARRILRDVAGSEDPTVLDSGYAADAVRELNVYAAADAVFAVSRKEAELVNDFVGDPTRSHFVPDCEDLAVSPVPFTKRRGMFFVGHFQHQPNVEAVEFLCREILPQFDPAALADHPVYIAGTGMTDSVRRWSKGLPYVRMLGWIPSVLPYLQRARISLVPLLNGAGTKRKIIQALAIGTPTVSTNVGVEGFDLRDGEEVLVADDPVAFANAAARLLRDAELWGRLARQGRDRILAEHGRQRGRECLLKALSSVLANGVKPVRRSSSGAGSSLVSHREYQQIIRRIQEIVCKTVPARSTVIVVSKGDDVLLNFGDRSAWHFPQGSDGVYAGRYPGTSAEAIAHLETLHSKGGDFLVFPKTAFWWLDHYTDFKQHLESCYLVVARETNSCIIFSLRERPAPVSAEPEQEIWQRNGDVNHDGQQASPERSQCLDVESRRPVVQSVDRPRQLIESARRTKVLVVGVYLADRFNNIDDIVQTLSQSVACSVVQRWAALRGKPPTQRVAAATALKFSEKKPKFEILSELLEGQEFSDFDYMLVCDDDIVLPYGFIDRFISLQSALGFSVAQPALTPDSFINHPIVEQQRGVVARETTFVEIGPVVSFHRSIFPLIFPFDMTSPMGWGYEQVWTSRLAKQGKTMGIIDAVAVDHGLRESVSNYSWEEAHGQREALFERHEDICVQDPFRVLAVAERTGTNGRSRLMIQRTRKAQGTPRISVVIPTHNRAALLEHSLKSLGGQSLSPSDFEVIVVDDGSADATPDVCKKWSSRLPLTRLRIQQSGISAAKNLGVFAATSPIILFFDDDDIADENLLAEHLKTHARYPLENVAVLGYTDWAPSLEISEVMRFVTDIGHYLFSYSHLVDGQRLDFSYFWGGRSSCKKSLLTGTGVFRQDFEFSPEDIELAFRISKRLVKWRLHQEFDVDNDNEELKHRLATIGLSVIFNRRAVQHMIRPLTYDDFCRRCERQGKLLWRFSSLYNDSIVHEWCQTTELLERWQQVPSLLPAKVARVHEIESMLTVGIDKEEEPTLLAELHGLYWWTFDAFKMKGMADARGPYETRGEADKKYDDRNGFAPR